MTPALSVNLGCRVAGLFSKGNYDTFGPNIAGTVRVALRVRGGSSFFFPIEKDCPAGGGANRYNLAKLLSLCYLYKVAEGRGFEPPVGLRLRLISSQVPLTTQPPFRG